MFYLRFWLVSCVAESYLENSNKKAVKERNILITAVPIRAMIIFIAFYDWLLNHNLINILTYIAVFISSGLQAVLPAMD